MILVSTMTRSIPLLLSVCIAGCTSPQVGSRPNILWITHEDLSPIYGAYGDTYARTPNIDRLAETGVVFTRAYSNAPICAPARSTLITGIHATSLGTQHLRSEIPVPAAMKTLPELLREQGYYTSNNVKTDYNFDPAGRWDDSSPQAHWRNRPDDRPFFSVFNHMITHEGPTNALRASDTESLDYRHNPAEAKLPPHLPDSPKMREIWAHKYDLLSVFDHQVGALLAQLEQDGLVEDTIVFLFSDHGTGLPGYKRWLRDAGLRVPFILHLPEKYHHLAPQLTGAVSDRMVAFVDFAPTVLALAGIPAPDMMEGQAFLGPDVRPRERVFGYRDRADDCYDVSRSVFDGRYLYVRHFMPQLPYYQDAVIFNKGGSYAEIRRIQALGELPPAAQAMLHPRPVEELFDLQADPGESVNLAGDPRHAERISQLSKDLAQWMIEHRDTGLINEGDMMGRAGRDARSVYESVRDYSREEFAALLEAALKVGRIADAREAVPLLQSHDSAVRFWGVVALDAYPDSLDPAEPHLVRLLADPSDTVAAKAAEVLIRRRGLAAAYGALERVLTVDDDPVVLQAAISVRLLGDAARPLLPLIRDRVMPAYAGEVWGRYRNWSYPMFIGMALDQARINLGEPIEIRP